MTHGYYGGPAYYGGEPDAPVITRLAVTTAAAPTIGGW